MSISVLAGIREYLSGCPLFDNGLIRVNYLEGEPIAYTVDEVPAKPVVRQYTDGSSLRQAEFVIASSEYYSRDEIENLKVSGFYEQLCRLAGDAERKRGFARAAARVYGTENRSFDKRLLYQRGCAAKGPAVPDTVPFALFKRILKGMI